MVRMARTALEAGAVGIGFGVAYVPGASRLEVLRLFELAAAEGVPSHLHIRHFGPVPASNSSLDAVEEVIARPPSRARPHRSSILEAWWAIRQT